MSGEKIGQNRNERGKRTYAGMIWMSSTASSLLYINLRLQGRYGLDA